MEKARWGEDQNEGEYQTHDGDDEEAEDGDGYDDEDAHCGEGVGTHRNEEVGAHDGSLEGEAGAGVVPHRNLHQMLEKDCASLIHPWVEYLMDVLEEG